MKKMTSKRTPALRLSGEYCTSTVSSHCLWGYFLSAIRHLSGAGLTPRAKHRDTKKAASFVYVVVNLFGCIHLYRRTEKRNSWIKYIFNICPFSFYH